MPKRNRIKPFLRLDGVCIEFMKAERERPFESRWRDEFPGQAADAIRAMGDCVGIEGVLADWPTVQ